ncbi:MAG: Do family serine endopeptidase [Elusimicrobiota bacterium]|jgi:serine protease Do
MKKFNRKVATAYGLLTLLLVVLVGGFRSGRLLYAGHGFHLAAYEAPAAGPVAQVHPEVLNLQTSFSNVAELVKPAVVSISTIHIEQVTEAPQFFFGDPMEQFFDQFFGNGENGGMPPNRQRLPMRQRQYKMEGVGSGVIIDPQGLVLTNEHVVRNADQIKVLMYDQDGNKTEYKATVVGKDARTDLAVIRVHAGHKLPAASLGDSDQVKVGDWAIAIGSPFGLSQTVTVGVISAARQSLAIEDREYRNLIQTDAAINRGNSGGPLLNIRGEVVGINTAIYAPTGVFAGIGFAVPVNQAKAILQDLVKKGHVVRGWLGVELAPEMTPAITRQFGLPDKTGALVNGVLPDSPAAKAGLKRGDVIRFFNGKPVESSAKLQTMVADMSPKRSIPLEIIRDRKKMTLTLVLGERPESADTRERGTPRPSGKKESKKNQKDWEGAHVIALSPDLAENFRQPRDAEGVLVTDVDSGSLAEELGLVAGDVIRAVNQMPTPDVSHFSSAVSKVDFSEGVVLDILRQGRSIYLSYMKGQ